MSIKRTLNTLIAALAVTGISNSAHAMLPPALSNLSRQAVQQPTTFIPMRATATQPTLELEAQQALINGKLPELAQLQRDRAQRIEDDKLEAAKYIRELTQLQRNRAQRIEAALLGTNRFTYFSAGALLSCCLSEAAHTPPTWTFVIPGFCALMSKAFANCSLYLYREADKLILAKENDLKRKQAAYLAEKNSQEN